MPKFAMEISFKASAAEAWNVLGEGYGTMCEWDSHMASTTLEGELGVGAVRHCVSAQSFGPFKPGTIKERLIEFEPSERTFAYEAFSGLPSFILSARNRWTVEAVNDEKCTVRFDATLELRGLTRLMWPLMRRMMEKDLERWLEDLRFRVEEGKPRVPMTAGTSATPLSQEHIS